jgi:hypothetical protein
MVVCNSKAREAFMVSPALRVAMLSGATALCYIRKVKDWPLVVYLKNTSMLLFTYS